MIDAQLREYAESPDRYTPVFDDSPVTRVGDARVCILQGTTWAAISDPCFTGDELDDVLAHVRSVVPAGKRLTWWIGPSARPANIVELLLARGFAPAADGPELRSLALTTRPPDIPEGVEVRRVETFEDFVASREIQWTAFEVAEDRRAAQREHLRREFEDSLAHEVPVGFLALLEGEPAATGIAVPSARGAFLIAGSTVPAARGRGLYRALVRARWDYAVARGTPALVTHAKLDTSYPILLRLGFVEVCRLRRLEERHP